MQKLLITIACFASLVLAGCSSFPLVHHIDIQQGNVITQDMVNRLRPGMSKQQVRFVMGKPLLLDAFHPERWDYVYYNKPGYGKTEEKHVALFFKGNKLERIAGTMHPLKTAKKASATPVQTSVVVPPQKHKEVGLFNRMWDTIRFWK
ncbi:MAG TPA: outer membrane protein assembly factor BamE [Gammaproteobacteria bacterium]|nr:outer membrane protein assembly factor BamE [Gammaproteobacteria bacterium]